MGETIDIDLDDWKWLRYISGNDTEAVIHYTMLEDKNECLMIPLPNKDEFSIYLPARKNKHER